MARKCSRCGRRASPLVRTGAEWRCMDCAPTVAEYRSRRAEPTLDEVLDVLGARIARSDDRDLG